MTPADILAELRSPAARLPEDALLAAMDQPEAVIPGLLEILEEALADPLAFMDQPDNSAHIFALYLLAQFREPRALPPALAMLHLPVDLQDALLGDLLTEGMPGILASLCADAPSALDVAAAEPGLDPLARAVAMDALLALGFKGLLPEDRLLQSLDTLLATFEDRGAKESPEAWGFLAETLATAGYPRFLPRLLAAFDRGLVDATIIPREDAQASLTRDPAHYRRRFLKLHHPVEDALLELEDQPWLDPDDEEEEDAYEPLPDMTAATMQAVLARQGSRTPGSAHPARNGPCPCGSGKKYKRCCGRG